MYAKVENGKVTSTNLPKKGALSNGQTVSNYNLLPHETLLAEGWLPLEGDTPTYDPETEYLTGPNYEILEDKVIRTWQVKQIPPPEPEPPNLEERLTATEEALLLLLMEG